jgi:hypothetical protein
VNLLVTTYSTSLSLRIVQACHYVYWMSACYVNYGLSLYSSIVSRFEFCVINVVLFSVIDRNLGMGIIQH